jgi:hypothetical protein
MDETMKKARRERMLEIINAPEFAGEPGVVREIAAAIVMGRDPDSEAIMEEIGELKRLGRWDEEAESEAMMAAFRKQWPEATDEEITRGIKLAVAVAETVKAN